MKVGRKYVYKLGRWGEVQYGTASHRLILWWRGKVRTWTLPHFEVQTGHRTKWWPSFQRMHWDGRILYDPVTDEVVSVGPRQFGGFLLRLGRWRTIAFIIEPRSY